MTVSDDRKRTVQAAYDALGQRFGEWDQRIEGDPWKRYLDELTALLAPGGRVLDLGCGNGAKIALLAERYEVVAVDLSEEQLALARNRLHVPREEHRRLSARIAYWLKPGGLFLASLSHEGGPDRTYEWLGVDMFFSGFDAETNRRLVRESGFELLRDELVWMRDPEGEVAFLWVLGRKQP